LLHLLTRRSARFASLALAVALVLPFGGTSVVLSGKPEELGFSSDRLSHIGEVFRRHIEARKVSGGVTIVARRGRVAHFEAHGLMDLEPKRPMQKDAVFRIASMSKPVTGVAIMMLVEQGKVRLSNPAMPRNDVRLTAAAPGQPPRTPQIYTVPASREVTVRDLLTDTSGLSSGGPGSREAARIAPGDGDARRLHPEARRGAARFHVRLAGWHPRRPERFSVDHRRARPRRARAAGVQVHAGRQACDDARHRRRVGRGTGHFQRAD
jgi:CubicO group peptidase (beta-lactamase class C family)